MATQPAKRGAYTTASRLLHHWEHTLPHHTRFMSRISSDTLFFFAVIGSIAVCCYPLWPPELRTGVYYLSLAGAAFLGLIIVLAICKYYPGMEYPARYL